MPTLLLLAALAVIPRAPVAADKVDLLEINHYYDDNGREVFTQAILYDWCDAECRHQVRAWRLLKDTAARPLPDRNRGGYFVIWADGDTLRRVAAEYTRETWTQHDPELNERSILPRENRKELGW